MGQKDFGHEFPKHGKSTGAGPQRKSEPVQTAGKPKSQVNAGHTFPNVIRPGGESKYANKKKG